MGDGIVKARDLLAGASTADKAIVLFSDGYDNKGCDMANPAPAERARRRAGVAG